MAGQINDVDGKGRSIIKQQPDHTPPSTPVTITSESSSVFVHKPQYPNKDTNTSNLDNSNSTGCLSTKSTENVSSRDSASQSIQQSKIEDTNIGGK